MEGIFGDILQFIRSSRDQYTITTAPTGSSAPAAASNSRDVVASTLTEMLDIAKTLTLQEVNA